MILIIPANKHSAPEARRPRGHSYFQSLGNLFFFMLVAAQLVPAPSTVDSRAAMAFRSQAGTGAPRAPAFSTREPSSVMMYQTSTSTVRNTV